MQQLEKLHGELLQENEKKVDVLAPLSSVRFSADGNRNYLTIRDGETVPTEYNDYGFTDMQERILELNPHALQQICSKMGVPMSYVSKCDPELRQHNLNHWLNKSGDTSLFRCTIDGEFSRVRGILSEKYAPVDDSFVVASLNDSIEQSNLINPEITRIYSGDDMLRLQVTDGKKPIVGDTTLGFFAGNSEVGLSKIYIEMGLYTFKCTNGLRIPNFVTEFNRKHIGNITYGQISGNFHTQIHNIMNNHTRMISYMKIANQITMKKSSFGKYIEENKNFSLAYKDSMKSRIKSLPTENVLWHYVSQMTEEAHRYREIERMDIEKHAGMYMDQIIMKDVKRGKYELATV